MALLGLMLRATEPPASPEAAPDCEFERLTPTGVLEPPSETRWASGMGAAGELPPNEGRAARPPARSGRQDSSVR